MIGQIVCIYINKKMFRRKVIGQYHKGKKRIYKLIDLDTKVKYEAVADLFDKMFKAMKTRFTRNRHAKGKTIVRKQLITG